MTPKQLRAYEDELIARYGARDSLAKWIAYRDIGLVPALHHELIIRELEAIERGEITRLMLQLPPGSAKSTYTSQEFPPWFIGRNPRHNIIAASHTLDFAERWGRKARNIVASREFKNVFDFTISEDSQAAGKWETTTGAEYFAVGVGGSVTGRRADLGIIDDPVKGREDADSERSRETVWQWYLNDFLTRLKPGARQVVIMTRWHELDLAGRILDREASKWRVVTIPMIAGENDPIGRKPGERLWPDWFTDEMVTDAQKDSRSWNALYQQNPIPDEGNFFKRDWFIEYADGELPSTLHKYGASDFAVTDKGGDFTEHSMWGVDFGGDLWLLDWWSGQTAPDVWIDRMCDLINVHKPMTWFGEAGPIRRSIEPFLRKRMDERRTFCNIEWLPSIMDKATRARSFQSMASMGKIKIPKDKPWLGHVMAAWLQFPAGRVDDPVDAASLIGRGLEFTRSAKRHEALVYPTLSFP